MTTRRARAQLPIAAVLALLPALVYLPSVSGPFLFDDVTAIVENPSVQGLHAVPQTLRFWQESDVAYRPLRFLSFAVDWTLGGGSPAMFHGTNIALHIAAALLLWRLLLALSFPAAAAEVAALLFALHPIQTGAVAYISGRKDLLCAVFYLLALHAALAAGRAARPSRRMGLSLAFFLAGLLAYQAKEMALTLPAAVVLLDLAARRRAAEAGARQARTAFAPLRGLTGVLRGRPLFYGLLLLAGIAALLQKVVLNPATKVPLGGGIATWLDLQLFFQTIAWHVRKALLPWPHAADLRGLFPQPLAAQGGWSAFWNGGGPAATGIGLLLLGGLVLLALKQARARLAAGSLAFFLIALLPVANLVPLNEPAAEHYLYLPLAGLAGLLGLTASGGAQRLPRLRGLATALLLMILAGATLWRSAVWGDELRLWRSAVAANAGSDRAWNNLGLALRERGDLEGARGALARAVALGRPPAARALANLAQLAREAGDAEEALRILQRGLDIHPDDALLTALRGNILLAAGRPAQARRDLERLTALPEAPDREFATWRRDLGVARLLDGDAASAAAILEEAVQVDPGDMSAWTNLGAAYLEQERWPAALRALEAAVALPEATGTAHRNLAVALLRLGRPAEAARRLDEARALGDAIPDGLARAVADSLAARSRPSPTR